MSNPIDSIKGRRVNPLWGIAIVLGMPVVIICVGLMSLEATFAWGQTTTDKEGNIKYANNIELRGWEAVPFQALAALIGTGSTAYGAYKISTKKEVTESSRTENLPPPPEL